MKTKNNMLGKNLADPLKYSLSDFLRHCLKESLADHLNNSSDESFWDIVDDGFDDHDDYFDDLDNYDDPSGQSLWNTIIENELSSLRSEIQ